MTNSGLLHPSNFFSIKLATVLVRRMVSTSHTADKCFRQTARKRDANTKTMDGFKDFVLYLNEHQGLNILRIQQKKKSPPDSAWFYDGSGIIRLKKKESWKSTVSVPKFRRNWWTLVFHSAAHKQQLHRNTCNKNMLSFSQIPQYPFASSHADHLTLALCLPSPSWSCTLIPSCLLQYSAHPSILARALSIKSLNTQTYHSLWHLLP